MKIDDIFVVVKDELFSLKYTDYGKEEFARLFEIWQDIEHVEAYFETYKSVYYDSDFKNIPIEEAIFQVIDEANKFEQKLLNNETEFRNLHKNDSSLTLTESKAYGSSSNSFLRVYALRIDDIYVITGGGIKFCEKMQQIPELARELDKLKMGATWLKNNFLNTKWDIVEFIL